MKSNPNTIQGNTERLLAKYASVIATNRSKKIEEAFIKVVPGWQRKLVLLTRSRILGKLFGWELRTFVGSEKWEIWNKGKIFYVSENLWPLNPRDRI